MILDTNALSALADGDEGLLDALGATAILHLPTVVVGEFEFGIASSRYRDRYASWLAGFLSACRLLVIDRVTAAHYASIRLELKVRGRPIPSNDTWIAALARQHGEVVVSRDAHFEEVAGLRRLVW